MKRRKLKKDFSFFYEFFSIFICFIGVVYLYLNKNDVPTFPRPDDEKIFDCKQIEINKISSNENKIMVNLTSHEFSKYPKLTAPYLLKVLTKNGDLEQCFNCKSFWDIFTNGNISTFNIISKSDGNVSVKIYCQDDLLYNGNVEVHSEKITKVNGFTHFNIQNDENLSYHINNMCINQSYITIFDENELHKTQKDVFIYKASKNISIPIKHEQKQINSFYPDSIYPFSNLLIVQSSPKTNTELLIDALIPIYIHQQKRGSMPIYFMDQNNKDLIEYSQLISNQPKESFLIHDGLKCTHDASLLYSIGNIEITTQHERTKDEQINLLLNEEINYNKFVKYFQPFNNNENNLNLERKTIVLSKDLAEEFNSFNYPECEFQTIEENQKLNEIIEILKTASVFIPKNDDFIHMLWLHGSNTSIITKYSNYSEKFAEILNLKTIDDFNFVC